MARSPQLGRFLDYIVRRTLQGDEQAIKAYSIAVDVFGRPPDFDPQADPIVRVQARRLRQLLQQYYAAIGIDDEVRITLPTGRYVPDFSGAAMDGDGLDAVAAPAIFVRQRGSITLSWFSLLVIALGIGALAYALSSMSPTERAPAPLNGNGPSVTIVEFQDLADDGDAPAVAGLALELVTDLDAFENIDAHYGGTAPADEPPSDFALTGIVRRADQAVQYSAILTETASGAVVWSRTIAVDEVRATQAGGLDEISRTLSLVLGSPRGPLHQPARRALGAEEPLAPNVTLYMCRVLFDLYREAPVTASGQRAADCFARLAETERQAPVALAASASLLAEGINASGAPVLGGEDRWRISGANLRQAAELAPLSAFVWEQQGRWFELQGQVEAASAAYASSIQLNPANADTLAAAARLMALQGHLSEAEPLAIEAVGSPMPPPWYFAVPTLSALRDSDLQVAIANAQTYAAADPELGSVLAVVAASEAGNAGVVSRYLPQVLEVAAFRASGILPQLRKRIGDAALLNRIGVVLTTAGVPRAALDGPF
ncbi:MAG: hypothetical protein ABI414_05025 [Devosia sp.]